MDNKLLSLSSTEDELITDEDGSWKNKLISQLESEASRLKNSENEGLSPEEFEQTNGLISAIEDAVKMIEITWAKHHINDNQVH